jgi:uncharacterized protein (DUF427 family)
MADDTAVESRGRVRVEQSQKWVRAYLGGELIVDSTRPHLVWEVPYYPAYYFPRDDVRLELFSPTARTERSPSRGEARYFDVKGGDKVALEAAWHYPESPMEALRDLIRIDWQAMDHWFEEEEEVFTHPRDPYSRVDILPSSRRVRVEVNGVTVAESDQPRILFETGLPPRYYLPLQSVRLDLLRTSDTQTHCPYKGTASYWSVQAGDQLFEDICSLAAEAAADGWGNGGRRDGGASCRGPCLFVRDLSFPTPDVEKGEARRKRHAPWAAPGERSGRCGLVAGPRDVRQPIGLAGGLWPRALCGRREL